MTEQPKNQSEQTPKRVEDLKNFPFKNFEELKKAGADGKANIAIDREAALEWVKRKMKGIPTPPPWLKFQVTFLASLTFIVPIGFIIYAVASQSWLLLLALPVLWFGFTTFHNPYLQGSTKTILIVLTYGGLAWGLINGINWLIAITLSLAVLFYSIRRIYPKAVNGLIKVSLEHEELFCFLWHKEALSIKFNNGNSYWTGWKIEDGKKIHYEYGEFN